MTIRIRISNKLEVINCIENWYLVLVYLLINVHHLKDCEKRWICCDMVDACLFGCIFRGTVVVVVARDC